MTTPTIVPAEYDVSTTDANTRNYLKVKQDRSGACRINAGAITIPTATASGSTVGLVPFNKGERFNVNNSSVYIGDADSSTNVTATVGYIYDDNVTFTNNLVAWVSASTVPQAGGFLTVNNSQGLGFVAQGNGWVVLQITGGATTLATTTSFHIIGAYDGLGVDNQNNQN